MSSRFMKPRDYQAKHFIPGSFLSAKLDGTRGLYSANQILSKTEKPFVGLDHIIKRIHHSSLKYQELDMELVVHGMNQFESGGLVRNHKQTPEVFGYVFDLPLVKKPFSERVRYMKALSREFQTGPVRFLANTQVQTNNEVTVLYQDALAKGFEGVVVKTPMHFYLGSANPTWNWMRLKEEKHVDLRITGYYEGKGRLLGTLGGLICEDLTTGAETRVGGGFSDEWRHKIWQRPTSYLGKYIEIAYQYRTPSGSYRHPRFKRFRHIY